MDARVPSKSGLGSLYQVITGWEWLQRIEDDHSVAGPILEECAKYALLLAGHRDVLVSPELIQIIDPQSMKKRKAPSIRSQTLDIVNYCGLPSMRKDKKIVVAQNMHDLHISWLYLQGGCRDSNDITDVLKHPKCCYSALRNNVLYCERLYPGKKALADGITNKETAFMSYLYNVTPCTWQCSEFITWACNRVASLETHIPNVYRYLIESWSSEDLDLHVQIRDRIISNKTFTDLLEKRYRLSLKFSREFINGVSSRDP